MKIISVDELRVIVGKFGTVGDVRAKEIDDEYNKLMEGVLVVKHKVKKKKI